jgi:hypothetical protein
MAKIQCPRCLGKKFVDEFDIKRLKREQEWVPGSCAYCEGEGEVDEQKPLNVAVDEASLVVDNNIESETAATELLSNLMKDVFEETVQLIINDTPEQDIITHLQEKGFNEEIAHEILESVKNKVNEIRYKAHRKVAGEYFLKGAGFIALGGIITGITYSMAEDSGGHYVVTTGLFAVGGIYLVWGFFKYLANL